MCGIAGIIASDALTQHERHAARAMLTRLAHRGPDDEGIHHTPTGWIGHRRLAILDSVNARQPLANESRTLWAAVNGEFYNYADLRRDLIHRGHTLATRGDSECLVHLYEERGADSLEALAGMFALAVWDTRTDTLLLARDRLGVKPLYYYCDHRRLIYASELSALLAAPDLPRELDAASLTDYLTFGFVPSPRTICRNVRKLEPGSCLTWSRGRAVVRKYWDLEWKDWITGTEDLIVEELWQRLRDATRRRLAADVPLGAFLSGGIDSSAVVAAMRRQLNDRVRTITCGFEGSESDERAVARRTADMLGANHLEVLLRADPTEAVEAVASHFDEPFADASAVPTFLLAREARRHMTVALTGDGGDEVLAGYRRYRFDRYEEVVRRSLPQPVRRAFFGGLSRIYPRSPWLPRPLRANATLRNLACESAEGHGRSIATMQPEDVRALLQPEIAAALDGHDPMSTVQTLYRRCNAPDHVARCQYVDLFFGLADGMLTKVDRAAMAHALEVRSPMLDYRFVEHACRIPRGMLIQGSYGKFALRKIVEQKISADLAWRPKSGFDAPTDRWFRGPLHERFCDEVLAPGARTRDWLRENVVASLDESHRSARQNLGPTLWKILMLEEWLRRDAAEVVQPIASDTNSNSRILSPV